MRPNKESHIVGKITGHVAQEMASSDSKRASKACFAQEQNRLHGPFGWSWEDEVLRLKGRSSATPRLTS